LMVWRENISAVRSLTWLHTESEKIKIKQTEKTNL
jgi:di/tripeptidase